MVLAAAAGQAGKRQGGEAAAHLPLHLHLRCRLQRELELSRESESGVRRVFAAQDLARGSAFGLACPP